MNTTASDASADTATEATDVEPAQPDPSAPTGTDADVEDVEPDAEHDDQETDPARKARQEAKGLRGRLRSAETERDTALAEVQRLTERVATVQRGDVERLAAALGFHDGADLWLGGIQLGDLLNDDGDLDTAKVRDACTRVLDAHPRWSRHNPAPRHMRRVSHLIGGASPADGNSPGSSWKDVIQGG